MTKSFSLRARRTNLNGRGNPDRKAFAFTASGLVKLQTRP